MGLHLGPLQEAGIRKDKADEVVDRITKSKSHDEGPYQ